VDLRGPLPRPVIGKNGDMRNFLRDWQGELKRVFTGSADALPEWVPRLADGNDAGYHLPGSAVWAVHGSMSPIVAGIRALLMQSLHPAALAGIHEHSDFRADPLRRLARTIQWIFTEVIHRLYTPAIAAFLRPSLVAHVAQNALRASPCPS
jgi:hypothetical protein